jgi:hypothetical protein
MRPAGLSSGID